MVGFLSTLSYLKFQKKKAHDLLEKQKNYHNLVFYKIMKNTLIF